MVNTELELMKAQGADTKAGRLEPRLIFVSHSHADRDLASGLSTLIKSAFSGVVDAFVSSDPAPTGGIIPGDEWYSQIQTRLRNAEAVWVLATPTSVTRPWIYWEAGIGKALYPKGVVVIRVGLESGQVPSPLSNFQTYDGLQVNEVAEVLRKVAAQIGMTPIDVLVETCAKDWVDAARNHKPAQESTGNVPLLTPERLDRLDAAIARLEAMSVPPEAVSSRGAARVTAAERQARIYGPDAQSMMVEPLDHVIRAVEDAPAETTFAAQAIDGDGDVRIYAQRGRDPDVFYLDGNELPSVKDARVSRHVRANCCGAS